MWLALKHNRYIRGIAALLGAGIVLATTLGPHSAWAKGGGIVSKADQTVYERRTHTNPEMSFSCSIARDAFTGIRAGMRHRETIPKSLGVATVHLQRF